ncbi:MAG: MBL fold metallo-hydrolase [Bacteroidia bacterium]
MKITFLGTGTSGGVPMIGCHCEVCRSTDPHDKRLRTSVLIEEQGKVLVVDTGPDFRQQMLNADVGHLDAVLFTHEHRDHTAGLDEVRAFNFLQRKPMDVFATPQVQDNLRKSFAYIFANWSYPGIPKLEMHLIGKTPFTVHGIKVVPVEVTHYKLPVTCFRIGDFSYITDANAIAPQELKKLEGTKILVLNALRKEQHISHFTLEEAITLSREINPEQTYFTHISHQMGLHRTVEKELPPNMHLAYDGLQLEL